MPGSAISRQATIAPERSARSSDDDMAGRGQLWRLATPSWIKTRRFRCRADVNRLMIFSRLSVGRCAFFVRLLRPCAGDARHSGPSRSGQRPQNRACRRPSRAACGITWLSPRRLAMRAVIKARVSRIHVVTMVERQRKTDSSWLQVPRLLSMRNCPASLPCRA
jgi:hypothetical protein